jgi:hypothetical protein
MKKENKPKLLIIGHARHGKDTLAEYFNFKYGMTFQSSSMAAAEIFIFEALAEKYGYESFEECFEDRMNRRAEWYDLICDYNKDDKSKLAKEILKRNDCYVGMRDWAEIQKCLIDRVVDLVIWVDASERLPLEPTDSFNINMHDADIIIQNNESLDIFKDKAERLGDIIFGE